MDDSRSTPSLIPNDLWYVCLRWPDGGSFSRCTEALGSWDAIIKVAQEMVDDDLASTFGSEEERWGWINERANDSMECCLVKDRLGSDLVRLFGKEMFPDDKESPINLSALREVILANLDQLLTKTDVVQAPQSEKTDLTFHSVDSGNCRIYYKTANGGLCCFQLDTGSTFKLYHCSRDGEPEHTIDHLNKSFNFPECKSKLVEAFKSWWVDLSANHD
ncbi:hypothetical protein [Pseudomonas abietaniphila]|uniref:Uncharacterized protein n=1 Tax=Pseudomonas abietaniphila TaxID=89065 RepID=A0A1G8QVI5_9PSED|nr:hypothetical protein [Pseudomonas abietaniphila]SDJ08653.1 hypothetical protein SAMN05216605_12176 [Pseudomonas abietaniphila]